MPRFLPSLDHPFLSPEAQVMAGNGNSLEIYAAEAESLLGIDDSLSVSESQAALITGAVARQISTLVEFDPSSVLLTSWNRGARSKSFRENVLPINPLAKSVVDQIAGRKTGNNFRTITSYRGRTLTPEMIFLDSTEYR